MHAVTLMQCATLRKCIGHILPFCAGMGLIALASAQVLPLDGTYKGASISETIAIGGCVYTISPASKAFTTRIPASSASSICATKTNTVDVTATPGCSWSAVADIGTGGTGWLAIMSGGGPNIGTGAAQPVTYRVLSNAHNASSRSGTVTILDAQSAATPAVHTVTQVADPTHLCP